MPSFVSDASNDKTIAASSFRVRELSWVTDRATHRSAKDSRKLASASGVPSHHQVDDGRPSVDKAAKHNDESVVKPSNVPKRNKAALVDAARNALYSDQAGQDRPKSSARSTRLT